MLVYSRKHEDRRQNDETIMETPEAWAVDIRKKRHLGDFVTWKEHDTYQAVLQRLLRDLQARSTPPIKAI